MNRANELLMVAYSFYAPKQTPMIRLIGEMEEDNEPDEAIAVTIAEALCDGLQYGNWSVDGL
jgi:hypothetical protein